MENSYTPFYATHLPGPYPDNSTAKSALGNVAGALYKNSDLTLKVTYQYV